MGARTNFTFKTDTGYFTLYSHWGGDTKLQDLAYALHKASPRLEMGDIPYALRNVVCHIIGPEWADETGFGFFVGEEGGEESYEPVLVDFTNGTVTHNNTVNSIQDFVNYYGKVSASI